MQVLNSGIRFYLRRQLLSKMGKMGEVIFDNICLSLQKWNYIIHTHQECSQEGVPGGWRGRWVTPTLKILALPLIHIDEIRLRNWSLSIKSTKSFIAALVRWQQSETNQYNFCIASKIWNNVWLQFNFHLDWIKMLTYAECLAECLV